MAEKAEDNPQAERQAQSWQRRFRVKDTSPPEPIITGPAFKGEAVSLGTFLPGHSYRLTPQNKFTVDKLEAQGRIEWEDQTPKPSNSASGPSNVQGSIKVKE